MALLLAGSVYFAFHPEPSVSLPFGDTNRIQGHINGENRVQWLILGSRGGNLHAVYLLSYEPLSNRFSAVYIDPANRIMSPTRGRLISLKQLRETTSVTTLRRDLSTVLKVTIPFWIESTYRHLPRIVDYFGGTLLPVANRFQARRTSVRTGENLRWIDGDMARDYLVRAYQKRGERGLRFRHKMFFLGSIAWLRENEHLIQPPLTRQLLDNMETNLHGGELKTSLDLLANLDPEKVKFPAVVPGTGDTGTETIDQQQVSNMLPRPLKEIVKTSEPRKTIKVQVLNGAGIRGLAGALRDRLQHMEGIDVVDVGNASRYGYRVTRIIDRSGNPQSAYRIHKILGTGEVEQQPSKQLMVDVTVIAGRDLKGLVGR